MALAPDLYGGNITHDSDEAVRLMPELPVARARERPRRRGRLPAGARRGHLDTVGAVGFCMGGGFVLVLAAQQGARIGAAVPFYGVLKEDYPHLGGITAPVQGHFGEEDSFTTPDAARALAERIEAESGTAPEFFFYPAGHAFFNDENLLGTYDKEQADLAWQRAVAFLREHVR